MLRTTVRDCLYLNWALPAESLPEPPAPLRYQRHSWQGRDWVFASALLFHQDSLHLTSLPRLRFGYPQLNVRVYVLDDEGIPSVLFRKMLMPAWVAPGVRLITHQPALARRGWSSRGPRATWTAAPGHGGPSGRGRWRCGLGRTARGSARGRAWAPGRTRCATSRTAPAAMPWRPAPCTRSPPSIRPFRSGRCRPRCGGTACCRACSTSPAGTRWPGLHSAWLCPEIPFVFELGFVLRVPAAPPRCRSRRRDGW